MAEDDMVGWHHQFNRYEHGQTPGDGEGQGGLACRSPWSRKESDTTEQLNISVVKAACGQAPVAGAQSPQGPSVPCSRVTGLPPLCIPRSSVRRPEVSLRHCRQTGWGGELT